MCLILKDEITKSLVTGLDGLPATTNRRSIGKRASRLFRHATSGYTLLEPTTLRPADEDGIGEFLFQIFRTPGESETMENLTITAKAICAAVARTASEPFVALRHNGKRVKFLNRHAAEVAAETVAARLDVETRVIQDCDHKSPNYEVVVLDDGKGIMRRPDFDTAPRRREDAARLCFEAATKNDCLAEEIEETKQEPQGDWERRYIAEMERTKQANLTIIQEQKAELARRRLVNETPAGVA